MRNRKAAVRYARALFREACQRQAVDAATRALAMVGEVTRTAPEFLEFVAHPLVPAAEKKRLCRELFAAATAPEELNFLDLLIDRKRVRLLPEVIDCFQALVDDYRQIIRAEVWSAVPLTDAEQERLREVIARYFGGEPVLTLSVHPELLGGVRVRVKDAVVDGCLRTALENLAAALKTADLGPRTSDFGPRTNGGGYP